MVPMKWLRLSYLGLLWIVFSAALELTPSKEFSRHTLIKPIIHHGREKREISSTKEAEEGVKHVDLFTITIPLRSKNVILDLRLNSDLIPKNYFRKHQSPEGGYITKYPKPHEIELCHYNGNIRGVLNSWVAVSTCNGIRGVIYDGQEMHYIENIPVLNETKLTDPHFLYSHSDLISSNFSCGSSNTPHFVPKDDLTNVKNRRIKRDTSHSSIHGPYNANKLSRYIELLMVIDNREYEAFNRDDARVEQHCKDISNIVNSLYVPLNIFIALVGVIIWSNKDEIDLEKNGDKTLTNFLNYRKDKLLKDHPNDNAQLLTKMEFSDGVVGKALKGPICTFEFSGGVNVDHSKTIGVVASTVAHEMGHNLGMEHDTPECSCPSEKCIMSPSSSSSSTTTEWSSCSIEHLTVAFEHGMDYCLRNKPEKLFGAPVCGNDFVEAGEQCDCGLKEKCNNPCCNASTCMLFANASCATGECCDLQTCKPHAAGTMCRAGERECDLPEYCTGQSEYCPEDVYKVDGEPCNNRMAYCYKGNCRSHSDQCKLLWGPSGQSSDLQCYDQNKKGTKSGNCGYNRLNMSYIRCEDENVHCGMLQCKHFNEKLEFGMESVAILSHFFISVDSSVIACRTAIVDLGLNERDPGLTPDGAKCGENKMCLNQKCMEINSLRAVSTPGACPGNCNGNGICNSKGHCHCKDGFAPPFCESAGVGGSEDSGPAAYPYHHTSLTSIFWYLMLVLVSLVVLLFLYSYYVRKSPSYFWKRSQRRTVYVPFLEKLENCRFCSSFSGIGGGSWSTWVQYRPRWWYKINTRPSKVVDPRSPTTINTSHGTKHVTITKTLDIVHTHLPGSNRSEMTIVRPVKESNQRSGPPVAIVSPTRAQVPPMKRSICKSDIKPVIINERDLPISNSPHDEENIYAEIGPDGCIYDIPESDRVMGPIHKPVSSPGIEKGASIRPNVLPPVAPKNIIGNGDLNREMAAKLARVTKNAANRVINNSNVGQNGPGMSNGWVSTDPKEVPTVNGDVNSAVRKFGGVLKTAPKNEAKSVDVGNKGSSLSAQKFAGTSEATIFRADDMNKDVSSVAQKFGGVLKTSGPKKFEEGDAMNKEISFMAQKFSGGLKNTAPKDVKKASPGNRENSSVAQKFGSVSETGAPKFGGVLKTAALKEMKGAAANKEGNSATQNFAGVSKTPAPNQLKGESVTNKGISSVAKKFGGVSGSTVPKIVNNDEQSPDIKCVNELKRMFDKK